MRADHAVIAPDSHVRCPLPGWSGSTAINLISPRLGARFAQTLIEMGPGTSSAPPAEGAERFVWSVAGAAELTVVAERALLTPGAYALIPPGTEHTITSADGATLMLLDKPYTPLPGVARPGLVVGREEDVLASPLLGDPDLAVRQLVPESPAHDLAMNTMTFAPGAALPFVEVHPMEHGLLMLAGTMVYRLGQSWYLLKAGDVVYMAPHCPQWAAAYGKTPARYLLYKDWHRDPLTGP